MMTNSPILGGILLLAAGLYQLTPMKDACLRHCRSPVHFIASAWRPGYLGAVRMGIVHGAYCLGCCWILMCLLFFGGVMSIWWIGGLTIFVLVEKVMPFGRIGGRILGLAVAAWGVGAFAFGVRIALTVASVERVGLRIRGQSLAFANDCHRSAVTEQNLNLFEIVFPQGDTIRRIIGIFIFSFI